LPDIREEPIIADQIILRPPSVSMSSSDTSTVNTSINSADDYAFLRIPDAIKFLPKYNGDSKLQSDFINNASGRQRKMPLRMQWCWPNIDLMQLIQLNMNHCKAVQDLLTYT